MPACGPVAVPGECPRRQCAFVPRRPLPLAPLPSSASGGGRVAPPSTCKQGCTCGQLVTGRLLVIQHSFPMRYCCERFPNLNSNDIDTSDLFGGVFFVS